MPNQTETAPLPPSPEASANREPGRLRRLGSALVRPALLAVGLAVLAGPALNETSAAQGNPVVGTVARGANALSDGVTSFTRQVPGAGLDLNPIADGTQSVSGLTELPDRAAEGVAELRQQAELEDQWRQGPGIQSELGDYKPLEPLAGDTNGNNLIDNPSEVGEIQDQLDQSGEG